MKFSTTETTLKKQKWMLGLLAALAFYAAIVSTLTFFRVPKIGYVNSSILLEKYPGFVEARKKLQKETEEGQKNVKQLETELNELGQEIVNKSGEWEAEIGRSKKEEMAKKQDEYVRYSRAVGEKAVKLEKELTQPVFDELNSEIARFGKERGYDVIFGTVAGGNILYAQKATDLTDEFLFYVKGK